MGYWQDYPHLTQEKPPGYKLSWHYITQEQLDQEQLAVMIVVCCRERENVNNRKHLKNTV